MLQYQYDRLLNDLSWEAVGQTIVNTVAQLPNIDIVILYIERPPSHPKRHFFWQREEFAQINRDLLKLTVLNDLKPSEDKIIVHQYREDRPATSSNHNVCLSVKIRSSIHVPLFSQQNLIASLTIHRFSSNCTCQEDEVKGIEIMANQASLLISQMLAVERLKELAKRETTINRITGAIRSSLEPPVMFAAIVQELGSALKVDGCTLSLWTKSDRFVRCVGLYNPHEPQKIIKDSPDWQQATTSSVPISENPILQALLYTKKTVSSADLEKQKKPSSL